MKHILFYPCCERDISESVKTWMHIIDDFWFAEINYTGGNKFIAREDWNEISWNIPNVRLSNMELASQRAEMLTGEVGELVPVKSFSYLHTKFKKSITIHFAGGCAVDVFNCLPTEKISVFINRGDHRVDGDGSSGICWLDDKGSLPHPGGLLQKVLSKLDVGSFIVTDGSNAIDALAPYWNKKEFPVDAHHTLKPVTLHGVRLTCVGMLEPKYGPTLIWQVVGYQNDVPKS